jgi:apolipoprotein N-acyltransferase
VQCRVLEIGIISSKLTGLVGLSSLAAAAIGLPTSWLTSSRLVQVLLLKAGFGIGILVVGYKTLDDLARFMDPAGPRKGQKKRQKQTSNGQNANTKERIKSD